jgi:hypothetical protein
MRMGWAERLNPRSDWTLREARRVVARHEAIREKEEREKVLNEFTFRSQSLIDWLYGRK